MTIAADLPVQPKEYLWEDLALGLEAAFAVTVTEEMMQQFLAITGDTNPLHVDPAFAARQGFPDRVVYGMLTAAFYSTLAGVHLPGRHCLLHGVDASFVKPVFVGTRLTISGKVSHLNDAYRQAQIAAQITDDGGVVVSRAKIRVGVLSPQDRS